MAERVAYIIPEFPGQTHIWMWREIEWMRRWGVDLTIFSTRRPPERDRARHAFADAAAKETVYLKPDLLQASAGAVLGYVLMHPVRTSVAGWRALTLPFNKPADRFKALALLPYAAALVLEMRRRRLNHIHSHTCSMSAVICMLARRLNPAITYSLTLNADLTWWGGAMHEKFAEAQFVVAITEKLISEIARDLPRIPSDKILLGRIGVDTAKWSPSGKPPTAGKIVSVGRLHPNKNFASLLRALPTLREKVPEVSLTLIGDGPIRAELEALANELHVADLVTFTGSLGEAQIIETISDAAVFAAPSHNEPLGVVYMEAMALALPTLGTTNGGVREIIDDGHTGLLVNPTDQQAITNALLTVLTDEPLRARLAQAGLASIRQKFDARIGAATLYQRLFNSDPPA